MGADVHLPLFSAPTINLAIHKECIYKWRRIKKKILSY